jgi:hypothetical protein
MSMNAGKQKINTKCWYGDLLEEDLNRVEYIE